MASAPIEGGNIARMLGVRGKWAPAVNAVALLGTVAAGAAATSAFRAYREKQGKGFAFEVWGKSIDARAVAVAGLVGVPFGMYLWKRKAGKVTPYIAAAGVGVGASYLAEKAEDWGDKMGAKKVAETAAEKAQQGAEAAPAPSAGVPIGRIQVGGKDERRAKRIEKAMERTKRRLQHLRSEAAEVQPQAAPAAAPRPAQRMVGRDPFIARKAVTPAEYARQYARLQGR